MTRRKTNSGATLIVTLMLLTVISMFVAVTINYSQRTAVSSRSLSRTQSAEAIANGCLELAFSSWRQISRNITPIGLINGTLTDGITGATVSFYTPPPTNAFAALMLPQASMFPDVAGFSATRTAKIANETVSNYKIQAVDPLITLAGSGVVNGPISSLISSTWPTFSLTTYNSTGLWGPKSYYYIASADVTLPSRAGPVTTRVRQVFEKRLASPFQFALFFMDDLEIQPSSPLTVFGAVHTNGKLYTATGNLTFDSTVPALLNNSGSAQLSGPEAVNKYPGVSLEKSGRWASNPVTLFIPAHRSRQLFPLTSHRGARSSSNRTTSTHQAGIRATRIPTTTVSMRSLKQRCLRERTLTRWERNFTPRPQDPTR